MLDGKILIRVGKFVEEELEAYRRGFVVHGDCRPRLQEYVSFVDPYRKVVSLHLARVTIVRGRVAS